MSVSLGWGKGNMVNIRSKEMLLLCLSVDLCRLTFVVRGCCIGRKSSIYLWSALEWKRIRADPKRESKKELRSKMEAKIFCGREEEIPPSRAHVSAATWLISADCFNQQKMLAGMYVFPQSLVLLKSIEGPFFLADTSRPIKLISLVWKLTIEMIM